MLKTSRHTACETLTNTHESLTQDLVLLCALGVEICLLCWPHLLTLQDCLTLLL